MRRCIHDGPFVSFRGVDAHVLPQRADEGDPPREALVHRARRGREVVLVLEGADHHGVPQGGERFPHQFLVDERPIGFRGVEEGDATLGRPAGQRDHRLPGGLVWAPGDRVQDRRVAGQDQLGVGDQVGVAGGRSDDHDFVAWPELVEVQEGVPGGYPVRCHGEVADLAGQRRAGHVAWPEGQLRQAGSLHDGEPPAPAEPGDADERERLPGDQVKPGGSRPHVAVGLPLPLQLCGEGMLMSAGGQRGAPHQVRQEQQHDGPGGDAALTEDAQHGPHGRSTISRDGGRHDSARPSARRAHGSPARARPAVSGCAGRACAVPPRSRRRRCPAGRPRPRRSAPAASRWWAGRLGWPGSRTDRRRGRGRRGRGRRGRGRRR